MSDDPDRHLWVVPKPEQPRRMSAEELRIVIAGLHDRNNAGWARLQAELQAKKSHGDDR